MQTELEWDDILIVDKNENRRKLRWAHISMIVLFCRYSFYLHVSLISVHACLRLYRLRCVILNCFYFKLFLDESYIWQPLPLEKSNLLSCFGADIIWMFFSTPLPIPVFSLAISRWSIKCVHLKLCHIKNVYSWSKQKFELH